MEWKEGGGHDEARAIIMPSTKRMVTRFERPNTLGAWESSFTTTNNLMPGMEQLDFLFLFWEIFFFVFSFFLGFLHLLLFASIPLEPIMDCCDFFFPFLSVFSLPVVMAHKKKRASSLFLYTFWQVFFFLSKLVSYVIFFSFRVNNRVDISTECLSPSFPSSADERFCLVSSFSVSP